ncbi:DUF3006 domain-containing protein [Aneurinibacillus sp. REN35]|uniref:DUF3006 domain-containing protein n=1 Tax=Aneurinibacillus sp. REN35 TaxID=3237286 RepID=UPI003528F857
MRHKKIILDRFEENIAVLEIEGESRDVPRTLLPKDAKPGDVLVLTDGKYMIDEKTTDERRKAVQRLMNELWED